MHNWFELIAYFYSQRDVKDHKTGNGSRESSDNGSPRSTGSSASTIGEDLTFSISLNF